MWCIAILLFLPVAASAQPRGRSVSAELGGPGFEQVAKNLGWETGTLTEEQMGYIRDPGAVKGGELRFSIEEFPATLRAYGKDENSQATRMINDLVHEPLITINPLTLGFLPGLASHWKVGEDGQTYFFRLDPKARFSDGHGVTTEDVLATYMLATDPEILSPFTNAFYEGFDPPVAISKYIFSVRSKEKSWKNLIHFGGTQILPAHAIDTMSGSEYLRHFQYTMLPGSGPYIIRADDVQKGKSVTLRRNRKWWGGDKAINRGRYNFDTVRMVVVRDEHLALEMFRAGEFDIYNVNRAQWWNDEFNFDEVTRGVIQKRRVFTEEPVGIGGFVFNMRKPPFDDEKVREAFILLFNREQILETLMYNQYTISDSYFPNSVYQNPNNPQYRYDPERAAELLAEAGYTSRNGKGILVRDGQPFVVTMAITEAMDRIITPVQQDLKKAGIDLQLRTVDGATNFRMLNERSFELGWINWGGLIFPNPITSYHSGLADIRNTTNVSGLKNYHADSLMELEKITYDQTKRIEILREIDSILMASKIYALSWHAPFQRIAYWNRFGHPDFYLDRIDDWRSIISTWWIDERMAKTVEKGHSDRSITMPVGQTDVLFWKEYEKRSGRKQSKSHDWINTRYLIQ